MADKQAETPAPREKLEDQVGRHGEERASGDKRPNGELTGAKQTEDMQQESIEVAQEAMSKFTIEKV
ncbi:hypothetical protein MHUMG1_04219 [Metarhizium humberi]|uniref:Uncharacterized protein n=1 Tax=Metarhizium humberi TaxID=2596975 RepID=A0A9P8MCN6_9HYPO|nr:hypothetical protein MHUMG1_04219 [Metarhizium humberi]